MADLFAVTQTTVGLIGAVAGFFGGIVSAFFTDYLRGRASREQAKEMLRAALLLVEDELRNAADGAASILQDNAYAPFPTVAWEANSVRLAGALPPEEWRVLAKAYDRVHGFNWRYAAGVLADETT